MNWFGLFLNLVILCVLATANMIVLGVWGIATNTIILIVCIYKQLTITSECTKDGGEFTNDDFIYCKIGEYLS